MEQTESLNPDIHIHKFYKPAIFPISLVSEKIQIACTQIRLQTHGVYQVQEESVVPIDSVGRLPRIMIPTVE